jgi:hypothetical protein
MLRIFTSQLYQAEKSIIAEHNVEMGHRIYYEKTASVTREHDVVGKGSHRGLSA